MSQFEEHAPASEDNEETVPDIRMVALTNREAVARRRKIEEVIESKRVKGYKGDYDFDLGK